MKRKLGLFFLFLFIGFMVYCNFFAAPYVNNIEKKESIQNSKQIIVNVYVSNWFLKLNKATYCLLTEDEAFPSKKDSNWVKAENGYCSFSVADNNYNLFVKDAYGNINSLEKQFYKLNRVLDIKVNYDTFYLYKDGEDKLEYSLDTIGNVSDSVSLEDYDSSIISVSDNVIHALDYGNTKINLKTSSGVSKSVKVIVSPFIMKPAISNKKDVACGQFSTDDNNLIDAILANRVDKVGVSTRAGVVEAARFMALEFAYRVPYFYENGRLNNYAPYYKVDGEGRYYHKGFYLSEDRKKNMAVSLVGPATWGCALQNFTNWGPWVVGRSYPNGLDCSGFVTWVLYNGGFNPGDIGAGVDSEHKDVTDLGTRVAITDELMNSGKVKVGDLIGLDGHTAILAGWDDSNYYIAESLNTTGGVVMTTVKRENLVHNSIYRHIVLMDDFYKEDGNLTTKW